MNLAEFLEELFAEGRVAVPEPGALSNEEMHAAARVLAEQDRLWRLESPEGAPEYDPQAAMWAATQYYRACQLAMFRDAGLEAITKLAESELESGDRPESHYSVDLTFRFLPDLVRIARSIATDDPLVELLMKWCRQWPMSSISVKGVGDVSIGAIAASPCLMQIYVDRVLAREDIERLTSEPVRKRLKQSLGFYGNLAPKMAAAAISIVEETDERR